MGYFPESLAIVGCGPSEIGTGNGKKIDSFENVIRMNNYVVSSEFIVDYGEKTTHWCHCGWANVKNRDQKYKGVFIAAPIASVKKENLNTSKALQVGRP